MGKLPIPFASRPARLPTIGRIRTGVKKPMSGRDRNGNPKAKPDKISTFRFTSQDHEAIHQIANLYGGTPRPWSDPKAAKGQLEVITEASEIRVILPPDPLGDTPIYEMFGGKGLERRCDGVTCERTVDGPDGPEALPEPCICLRRRKLECKGQLRLSVLLDEVRVTGVWRLDSKSEAACEEMPTWVRQIQALQGSGLAYAVLRIQPRVSRGGRNEFNVPMLGIPANPQALASGAARLGALPSAAPALGPAPVDELQEALDALTEDARDEVREWWISEQLPKKAELTDTQRDYVLAHLAG